MKKAADHILAVIFVWVLVVIFLIFALIACGVYHLLINLESFKKYVEERRWKEKSQIKNSAQNVLKKD
jgi:biopolymer transport protein ExbB/TolQ